MRRVHLESLRGLDPVTLDITISDVLRRPVAQLAPPTLCDLLAVAEVREELNGPIRRSLESFAQRVARSVLDIPDGGAWKEFIDELAEVEGPNAPASLRDILRSEVERGTRDAKATQLAESLLDTWNEHEPEAWHFGKGTAKIQRPEPAEAPVRRRRVSGGAARSSRAGATGTSSRPARTARPKKVQIVDQERVDFLKQMCVERLATYAGKGLAPNILVAGVQHRARSTYTDLQPSEVHDALKRLEQDGRIELRAKRWVLTRQW